MDNLLRICSLDQLADDTEMQDYLTVRISQRQLEQTAFEVKPVLGPVEKGDYLVVTLHSKQKRYQAEQARICVGKGLWNAAFEAALVGLMLGRNCISVDGVAITVELHSIKRKVQAEITDAFVGRQFLDGVDTREDYLKRLEEQHRETELAVRKKMLTVRTLEMLRARSSFPPLEDRIEELYRQQIEARRYKAERKGCTLDEVLGPTPEIREEKKRAYREKATQLAQYYEIVAELARRNEQELACENWGPQAMEMAVYLIKSAFGDQFRVVYEA